jgi:hypothetical protein
MKKAEARTDTVVRTPKSALGSYSGARVEVEKGGLGNAARNPSPVRDGSKGPRLYSAALGITHRKRRRSMLPHDEELLSDEDLREASIEQLDNLRARVNLALQRPAEREGIQRYRPKSKLLGNHSQARVRSVQPPTRLSASREPLGAPETAAGEPEG